MAVLLQLGFGRSAVRDDRLAHPRAARYLLWAAVLSYLVWLLMFAIYRYAIPLEMLGPLLLVFAVGMLPLRLQTRGIIAACVLALVAITIQPGNWTRRAEWLDHTVELERPALPDDPKVMLLMAGYEPYSHLATQFPPRIPVVRIESNFASPVENKGINSLLRAKLTAHRQQGGRFVLLIPPYQHAIAQTALNYFQLTFLPESCRMVRDRLIDVELDLCDVVQLAQP